MTHVTNDDSNHRSRNWIGTLNNYTDVEHAKLVAFAGDKCAYGIIAKEVGKTGTPHLQFYFQMRTSYSGQSIKNQVSKRLWLGIANSPKKSKEYCMKDGDFIEVGKFTDTAKAKAAGSKKGGATGSGARATQQIWFDLDKDVNAGMTEFEIKKKYPNLYYRYTRGIEKGIQITNAVKPRTEKTCVHVIIGPAGVGKTTKAQQLAGQDAYFQMSVNGMWWDGYDGQSAVVLDDFHGNMRFDYWKRITDKFPMQVEYKGGMRKFTSNMIVITSNLPPTQWWKEEVLGTHGLSAMYRRINVLEHWDAAAKDFVPLETGYPLWNEGCTCKHLTSSGTVILGELDDSEDPKFADEPSPSPPQAPRESKRRNPFALVPSKKLKLNFHDKETGELAEDPVVLDSDSSDVSMDSDSEDSSDSDDPISDDLSDL